MNFIEKQNEKMLILLFEIVSINNILVGHKEHFYELELNASFRINIISSL